MTPSKEDRAPSAGSTATVATDRLASLSLTTGSGHETVVEQEDKFCSACKNAGDSLKKCTACKCVWYCDVSCQKAHRKAHKKDCKRIAKVLKEQTDDKVKSSSADDDNFQDEMFCSACGKSDGDLKGCNSCRCIRYCSSSCQRAHWKTHKVECKRIEAVLKKGEPYNGTYYPDLSQQLHDENGLFNEPPTMPDCDICTLRLPLEYNMSTYMECCGKTICSACNFDSHRAIFEVNSKRIERQQPLLDLSTCPFCRDPGTDGNDERIKRMKARAEMGDATAMWTLAIQFGLVPDEAKSLHLAQNAAELGCTEAQYRLGCIYANGLIGVELDETKADMYFELAAKNGHVLARHHLGKRAYTGGRTGQTITIQSVSPVMVIKSIRHWRISAAAGYTPSLLGLIKFFELGLFRHKDLAPSVRARDKALLEMKSESRDRWVESQDRSVEDT
mmetsp:Transcript_16711/g.47984  ORF Transcript_16711/g.47984 Transcript_16711/m.47984 type:complete len:445 (-) Transcript_16711:31-1365(-)